MWSVPAVTKRWAAPLPKDTPRFTGVAWHPAASGLGAAAAAGDMQAEGPGGGAGGAGGGGGGVVQLATGASDGVCRLYSGSGGCCLCVWCGGWGGVGWELVCGVVVCDVM